MKLGVSIRPKKAKSERTLIRHEGNIPAVLYTFAQDNINLTVDGQQFRSCLRNITKGHLPTSVFEIDVEGKKTRAVVKEIQYHPTTYNILHLDLEELKEDKPIKVNIPIDCVGVADCIGIKLGGFLRLVKRQLRVKCLPKDLPSDFKVDVRDLNIGQSRRVKDLIVPKGCALIAQAEDVLVIIAKR